MARSFYYGTDGELYAKSKAFTALILAAPSDYGLTLDQCQAYAALDADYQASYLASADSYMGNQGDANVKRSARAALMKLAADLTRIINGTPSVTDAQKGMLGISVPGGRAPVGPPGKPTEFSFTLDAIGALHLKWKCPNPRGSIGTMYQIYRRIDSSSEFVFLGVAGARNFVDSTIPAGSAAIVYRIQGIRAKKTGPSAEFNVNFGTHRGAGPDNINTIPRIAA